MHLSLDDLNLMMSALNSHTTALSKAWETAKQAGSEALAARLHQRLEETLDLDKRITQQAITTKVLSR